MDGSIRRVCNHLALVGPARNLESVSDTLTSDWNRIGLSAKINPFRAGAATDDRSGQTNDPNLDRKPCESSSTDRQMVFGRYRGVHPSRSAEVQFVPRHTLLPHVDQAMVLDTHAKAVVPTSPAPALDEILYLGLLSIVISVSIGLLLRSVFAHIRFAMGLRSCRLLDDPLLIDLVLREGDSLGVGRRPALREVQSLAAPAVLVYFDKRFVFRLALQKP